MAIRDQDYHVRRPQVIARATFPSLTISERLWRDADQELFAREALVALDRAYAEYPKVEPRKIVHLLPGMRLEADDLEAGMNYRALKRERRIAMCHGFVRGLFVGMMAGLAIVMLIEAML